MKVLAYFFLFFLFFNVRRRMASWQARTILGQHMYNLNLETFILSSLNESRHSSTHNVYFSQLNIAVFFFLKRREKNMIKFYRESPFMRWRDFPLASSLPVYHHFFFFHFFRNGIIFWLFYFFSFFFKVSICITYLTFFFFVFFLVFPAIFFNSYSFPSYSLSWFQI